MDLWTHAARIRTYIIYTRGGARHHDSITSPFLLSLPNFFPDSLAVTEILRTFADDLREQGSRRSIEEEQKITNHARARRSKKSIVLSGRKSKKE